MNNIKKAYSVCQKWMFMVYDILLHYISNTYAWKCSCRTLLEHYNYCLSDNHLDVGVGTGYFLSKYDFKANNPQTGEIDLDDKNLLKDMYFDGKRYDSISLNYVMHCLPSTFEEKGMVFKNLQNFLTPDGVLFGSTILNQDFKKSKFSNLLMSSYNKKGIFHNLADSEESLKTELLKYFNYVHIRIEGTVALFFAKNYRLFTKLEV